MEKLQLPDGASHIQKRVREMFLLPLLTWGTFPFISSRQFIFVHILQFTSPKKENGKRASGSSHGTSCRGPNISTTVTYVQMMG